MIIHIKTQCYFEPCGFLLSLCIDVAWLLGFTVFWRSEILYSDVLYTIDKITEQNLLSLPEHMSSPSVYSGVRFTRSLVLCVILCRWLFVLFLWLLCCLSFFDLRLLITSSVSSNLGTPWITNKGLGGIGANIGPISVLNLKAFASLS